MSSVQPEWCRELPLQQQSVLFLGARGPDGAVKDNPCKAIQRAYRGTVFVAAKYNRMLRFGEKADSFMSLDRFADFDLWNEDVEAFMDVADGLPIHFVTHLMHGAQILAYKHPDPAFRANWLYFYEECVKKFHLNPESVGEMDRRLGDWDQEYWVDPCEEAGYHVCGPETLVVMQVG
jgi:hypothetical protein